MEDQIQNQVVTPDQVREAWDDFLKKLKSDGRDREYNILNQQVVVNESLQIRLLLPNSFQVKTIEEIQQELLTELRVKLQNNTISLVTEIERQEDKKMIYTNSEKFEYLANKYPLLRELKQRLDLDTDF